MSGEAPKSSLLNVETNPIQAIDAQLDYLETIRHGNSQQVITLAQQAHDLALPIDYWHGIAKSLYYMADSYLRLGNYAAASAPAQKSLIVAEAHQLFLDAAYALSALGAVYAYLGDGTEALACFLKQLKIAEEYKHPTLTAYALGDIGSIYLTNDNYEMGLEHVQRCYQIFDSINHEEEKYIWFTDVGNFYIRHNDYEKAFATFQEMHALGERNTITEAIILGLTGMARAQSKLSNYEAAHRYLEQALGVARQSQSFLDRDVLLVHGEVYSLQNQPQRAIEQFNYVLELASQTEHWNVLVSARQQLADLYEKMGDYQQALQHHRAYEEIKNKSFNDRSASRLQILHTLYEIENVRKIGEIHQLRSVAAERELNEYKQAEVKRLELERLKVALDKEREFAALKERILTRISHEFRTPLTIIRTSTELLTHYAANLTEDKRQSHQDTIAKQFKWIEKHLRDINTVLHAESPKIATPREQVDIYSLCTQAIQTAELQTRDADRILFKMEASSEKLWIDSHILSEILTNILSNALKFSADVVTFKVVIDENVMLINVSDSGIGIPEAELEKVFEPLFRGSNIDEVPGSGLGLTIVRDYVSLLDGQLSLRSELKQGTQLTISIPLFAAPA